MHGQFMKSPLGFSCESTDIALPRESMPGLALFIFQKNMAGIICNLLNVFENSPVTVAQVETILNGMSVGGVSIYQLEQVKRLGDGARRLATFIKNKEFQLDVDIAKQLHAGVGKEEALESGVLRDRQVQIRGVAYIPPAANELPELVEAGFAFLRERIKDPVERAIMTFLFMARTQFFSDCNKRTAALMMNGVLLSEGIYPFIILKEDKEIFNAALKNFYNSGYATEIFKFFSATCHKLYESTQ